MPINFNASLANVFRYGNHNAQKSNIYGNRPNAAQSANSGQDVRDIKRMLSGGKQADKAAQSGYAAYSVGIMESANSYADSLRMSREKAKDTSLKLKKLRYEFKSISTEILRSKTSANAKQVASKARREVMRLKRQARNGEYDEEELQSAIAHAEAMERVAEKKARHLMEEEMVKVTGGPCAGEAEEKEEQKADPAERSQAAQEKMAQQAAAAQEAMNSAGDGVAQAAQERMEVYQEIAKAQMEEMQEMLQAQMEEMMEEMQRAMEEQAEEVRMDASAQMEDMMSQMMDEMSDSMKELLEDSGLSELADSMFASGETEMDPADYQMMKLKHRSDEMKAIAKADAEYLKALFDRLEKMKGSSMGNIFGSGGNTALGGFAMGGVAAVGGAGMSMPGIDVVSTPDAVPSGDAEVGGSFDLSI